MKEKRLVLSLFIIIGMMISVASFSLGFCLNRSKKVMTLKGIDDFLDFGEGCNSSWNEEEPDEEEIEVKKQPRKTTGKYVYSNYDV